MRDSARRCAERPMHPMVQPKHYVPYDGTSRTVRTSSGESVIRISVEVRNGDACFLIAAWAESVERAVNMVKARYPGQEVSVVFPIEPDSFFVDRDPSISEVVNLRMSDAVTR